MENRTEDQDLQLAWGISLGIRLVFGLIVAWVVWKYEQHPALYLVVAVFILTAFFKPRRCVNGSCDPAKNQKLN